MQAFIALCVGRFLIPFFFHPMENITSDMHTLWKCAATFLSPTYYCATLPKLFLFYLYLQQSLVGILPYEVGFVAIAVFAGALCALLPVVWYLACREIMPPIWALAAGILIAITPSLYAVYAYFLSETLALVLMGVAFWLTFRAIRLRKLRAYAGAVALWMLALLAKQTMLPFALGALAYAWIKQPARQRPKAAIITLCVIAAFMVPAGLHSYGALKIFAPLRYGGSAKLYRLSDTIGYGYRVSTGEMFRSTSGSMQRNPFEPFGVYRSWRKHGISEFYIDATNPNTWKENIARLKQTHTLRHALLDTEDAIVYLFFSSSWPDDNDKNWLNGSSYHTRWMWAPLLLLVLLSAPVRKLDEKGAFILTCTGGMILLLMFQQSAVMEGRYRKPLEPLLLVSAIILLRSWVAQRPKKRMAAPAFVYHSILRPYWQQCISSGRAFKKAARKLKACLI